MAKFRILRNNNKKSTAYNKYFPQRKPEGVIDTDALAARLAGRTSAFSEGEIRGMLIDLSDLVLELAFQGYSVKLKDLGIFWVAPKADGVYDVEDFDTSKICTKLRCRATGDSSNKAIGVTRANGVSATWEEDVNYQSPRTPEPEPEPEP